MKKAFLLLSYGLLWAIGSSAQIQASRTPYVSAYQPLYGGVNNAYQQQYHIPAPEVKIGASANEVTSRQQQQAIYTTVAQKQQELTQLMRELQHDERQNTANHVYQPLPNHERTKDFPKALQQLKDMLSGQKPLSVADAYFAVENAYGNPYFTKQQYDSTINQSVSFIKTWMLQNGLDMKDNYMVHHAIKKFMSEELMVTEVNRNKELGATTKSIIHKPFHYDYDDYTGEKDMRNMFVTKCLATGFGQCASMPGVYLVLAEKLGVKAYLTIAPQHSFIKHLDNSGYIVNYEPTSNWEISDKWYKDNMFISAEAVRSGIYLDTLNSKQVVANCIFDLAVQYMRVDLTGREDFILNCIDAGIPYFPKNNNLQSLFIYSTHLKTMLRELMRKHNITNIENIAKVPEVQAYYREYLGNETYITKLGYQEMPAGLYEEMLNQHEFKGKVQGHLKISGKEKRNLFVKTSQ